MEAMLLHHDVRTLITEADHLSRRAYAAQREREAEVFASLRTSLQRLDRWLGAPFHHRDASVAGQVDLIYQRARDVVARAPADLRAELEPFRISAERLHDEVAPPRRLVAKLPAFLRTF
jgi:hypothetical protein